MRIYPPPVFGPATLEFMTTGHRTLEYLRGLGHTAAMVEKWNPHAFIRQDLFGCIDILSLCNGTTYAWQTSTAHINERIEKIKQSKAYDQMKLAGWQLRVIHWRKIKTKRGSKTFTWEPRVIEV